MATAEKLDNIIETKEAIRTTVGISEEEPFNNYPAKIQEKINSGGNKESLFNPDILLRSGVDVNYLIQKTVKTIPKDVVTEIFKKFPKNSLTSTFTYAYSLEELDLSDCDTTSFVNFNSSFNYCYNLIRIKGIIDCINNNSAMSNMFYQCENLEEVYIKNLNNSIYFNYSPKMKKECLVYLINNAQEVTETKIINLGTSNSEKLTTEEKAVATSKGYTLV